MILVLTVPMKLTQTQASILKTYLLSQDSGGQSLRVFMVVLVKTNSLTVVRYYTFLIIGDYHSFNSPVKKTTLQARLATDYVSCNVAIT